MPRSALGLLHGVGVSEAGHAILAQPPVLGLGHRCSVRIAVLIVGRLLRTTGIGATRRGHAPVVFEVAGRGTFLRHLVGLHWLVGKYVPESVSPDILVGVSVNDLSGMR